MLFKRGKLNRSRLSFILVNPILQYFSSFSIQIQFLLVLSHATAVVKEPAQLSRTVSPSLVYVFIRYSQRATGFCVGCKAHFCLSVLNVNTLFGYRSVLS